MEIFTKTKAVKLRSHLDKYIVADEDQETVRQSRNRHTQRAIWTVELIDSKPNVIYLKSCNGNYLTASNKPFLLGMTGNKILQTAPKTLSNWEIEWEPIKDGYQVKLKSWCGKFLRGNGGTPPWRNSVTHDEPCTGSTQRWILWNVEAVGFSDQFESFKGCEYLSSLSSFSSSVDGDIEDAGSPVSVVSMKSDRFAAVECVSSPRFDSEKSCSGYSLGNNNSEKQLSLTETAMEFFHNAKAVRLRSHHNKYLLAEDDEESVTQDKNGSSKNARWNVEFMHNHAGLIRLKSCHGKYLTASNEPFLLGMTGRKVLQTMPKRLDSSVEWEPVREGNQVKLKTKYGHFLRANGRLPPWRNSVTHDIPRRSSTQDYVLWDIDVVEIQVQSPSGDHDSNNEASAAQMSHSDSLDFEANSPSSDSEKPANFSRLESNDSFAGSPSKSEGRTIYYHVADESGDVDDDTSEGGCMIFKGKGVEELTRQLEEETAINEIVVCTRSPLNGKLFPLRLQLPPNNATMLVVVVPPTSKLAKEFSKKGDNLEDKSSG